MHHFDFKDIQMLSQLAYGNFILVLPNMNNKVNCSVAQSFELPLFLDWDIYIDLCWNTDILALKCTWIIATRIPGPKKIATLSERNCEINEDYKVVNDNRDQYGNIIAPQKIWNFLFVINVCVLKRFWSVDNLAVHREDDGDFANFTIYIIYIIYYLYYIHFTRSLL